MSWLAWRQARAQIAAGLAAVAAIAIAAVTVSRGDSTLRLWLSVLVVVIPGLLGAFWGAPLVAGELESGSFRLAWTQDVSRARWLAARLTVSGLASMAAAGLASWLVTWWAGPLDRAGLDQFGSFDSRDIVPLGYAAFAFALGVLLGALLRRTVPAMAATLLAFTAARLAFRLLARPHLLPPVTRALALDPSSTGYGSSGFLPLVSGPALQPRRTSRTRGSRRSRSSTEAARGSTQASWRARARASATARPAAFLARAVPVTCRHHRAW
jgi:hypothetical protein